MKERSKFEIFVFANLYFIKHTFFKKSKFEFFSNKLKFQKVVRLAHLTGATSWHFTWADEYYSMNETDKTNIYVKMLDMMIINRDENNFTEVELDDDDNLIPVRK